MSSIQHSRLYNQPKQFRLTHPTFLALESGQELHKAQFSVQTWGQLNSDKSNVIWVCHALTGNHLVHEWWGGLFGEDKLFNPNDFFIVCVNIIGSCYGSTGPLCFNERNERYFRNFPLITIRDMVSGLDWVREQLQLDKIKLLIGASVGGQQVLEWAVQKSEIFETIIPIATNAVHSPYAIALNEAQRMAIEADPTFGKDDYSGGKAGLAAARSIAMVSYRSYAGYALTQSETDNNKSDGFKAASYQQYQGDKLTKRFNAYSYWYLSKAMDSHNLGRNREEIKTVLESIQAPTLVVGIDSDGLFPLQEQAFLAKHIPNSEFLVLSSDFGHDGFLVEFDSLGKAIKKFLENNEWSFTPLQLKTKEL